MRKIYSEAGCVYANQVFLTLGNSSDMVIYAKFPVEALRGLIEKIALDPQFRYPCEGYYEKQ